MTRLLRVVALVAGAASLAIRSLQRRLNPTDEPADEEASESRSREHTKQWLFWGALGVAALGLGGFLVAASGIIPIKASSGHWPITEWLLHFSMKRSIATHTIGLEPQPLDDPGLVLKGAGHFETGCRPCHGSPELPHPRIPAAMTPHPPNLATRVPEWAPEELFYIVKHGVKFTGMPAWPAQSRDDEVWAMTAFLLVLPGLDVEEYRSLTTGEEAAPPETPAPLTDLARPDRSVPAAVAENCARCHGRDGRGRGVGAFPSLAGQRPEYLAGALRSYAAGVRHSGVMQPLAAGLTEAQIMRISAYYGGQATEPAETAAAAAVERGRAIAQQGIPQRRVPPCIDCHGPSEAPKNRHYPLLAGQYADYLILQLEIFQKNARGGSRYAHLMRPVASRLDPEQMRDVARYYESLTAAPERLGQR